MFVFLVYKTSSVSGGAFLHLLADLIPKLSRQSAALAQGLAASQTVGRAVKQLMI
jgi:hypothetical protein